MATIRYTRSPSVFSDSSLSASFLRTTAAKNPRTVCGCQPVQVAIVAMVAPLGRRSSRSTRACFEFARLLCSPLRAVFGLTLDEACAFATRPRLRLDNQNSSHSRRRNIAPPLPKPRGGLRALAGGEKSEAIRLAVRGHTHALFALKVQRKVSNGVLDWPAPDHLWIGQKSRQFLPSQRCSSVTNARASIPAEILATLGSSCVSRTPRRWSPPDNSPACFGASVARSVMKPRGETQPIDCLVGGL